MKPNVYCSELPVDSKCLVQREYLVMVSPDEQNILPLTRSNTELVEDLYLL
jgi:hypothetical protein